MKSLAFLLVAFGLAGSLSASAQTTPGPQKVAVIAFQQGVTLTNEFQRDLADIQKKYLPRRTEIKSLSDQIESLKKQLQSGTLSPADRASRTQAIQAKQKSLDRAVQEAQTDFQTDLEQDFGAVAGKFDRELGAYAKMHGYVLVLDAGSKQDATVLWATPATDVTKAVVEEYNTKSGIPAPVPQTAASPAPQPAGASHGAGAAPTVPSGAH
jgi:outer membrane protein